ncbi:MarR family winged helix-turn-helix transcriptional regulator [Enterococcus faecalis]
MLASEENVTAGRIAEYLDIKPSSVTQIIKKLESVKAVKRVKNESDARVTFVVLTDKGRESLSTQEIFPMD